MGLVKLVILSLWVMCLLYVCCHHIGTSPNFEAYMSSYVSYDKHLRHYFTIVHDFIQRLVATNLTLLRIFAVISVVMRDGIVIILKLPEGPLLLGTFGVVLVGIIVFV